MYQRERVFVKCIGVFFFRNISYNNRINCFEMFFDKIIHCFIPFGGPTENSIVHFLIWSSHGELYDNFFYWVIPWKILSYFFPFGLPTENFITLFFH